MQKILLVEPNYKNKYPPIGLMKIATYHKLKGDYVEFHKGKAAYLEIIKFDRIYITSLFTFHYEITINTILHYKQFVDIKDIFIGGISATLLQDSFINETGIKNVISGQLTSSKMLGYNDNINIDNLSLDYDILDDIEYKYPAGDNFFVYTTRGCIRKCKFCAVRILEPKFITTNNIETQIQEIRKTYGDKRNLMIMDNNILASEHLGTIVDSIVKSGFTIENKFLKRNPFIVLYEKILRRDSSNHNNKYLLKEMMDLLQSYEKRIKNNNNRTLYLNYIKGIIETSDKVAFLISNKKYFEKIFEKYTYYKRVQRYVDFNQGIDARLLDKDNIKIISRLPLRPFRLAFDNIQYKQIYTKAFKLAADNGIKYFSNYLLYNYEDKPKELWKRIYISNVLFNYKDKISGFSFPMKYSPIDQINRDYIGDKWNKKYLNAISIILNVTNGVVAREMGFFFRAFGKTEKEFINIISMPDEFIRYRNHFDSNGKTLEWGLLFKKLNNKQKKELFIWVEKNLKDRRKTVFNLPKELSKIAEYYLITYKNEVRKKPNNTLMGVDDLIDG